MLVLAFKSNETQILPVFKWHDIVNNGIFAHRPRERNKYQAEKAVKVNIAPRGRVFET